MPTVAAAGRTEIGNVRKLNEDAYRIYRTGGTYQDRGTLLVVSDGMGSYRAGAQASAMTVDQLSIYFQLPDSRAGSENDLQELLLKANEAVARLRTQEKEFYGMGATVTALWIDPTASRAVAWQSGDSMAYLARGGKLHRITIPQKDPSTGELTNHVGIGAGFTLEKVQMKLQVGDILMVSSDGIHGFVSDEEILSCLRTADRPDDALDLLFSKALAGSDDNLTAIVARILP